MDQRPDIKGRPGLNPLRFTEYHTVDRPAIEELRRISSELGLEAQKDAQRRFRPKGTIPEDTDSEFRFMGKTFALGEKFGISTKLHARDLEGNLKWVKDARRMSDWVIVSVHCHESGKHRDDPPGFLVDFAKKCIDEGADIFIGHGPHVTRGVEIYKGKPIFYSLGNFVFQNDTVRWQPSFNYDLMKMDAEATPADFYDARSELDSRGFPGDSIYWESVVVKCEFVKRRMSQITLHPIDLGYGKSRGQRGRPVLAASEISKRILERMQRLSKSFGTSIKIYKGVGVVKL